MQEYFQVGFLPAGENRQDDFLAELRRDDPSYGENIPAGFHPVAASARTRATSIRIADVY